MEYTACLPCPVGDHSAALTTKRSEYGLADGDEGKIRGGGDEKVLRALKCLSELKAEGKIRMIGISGGWSARDLAYSVSEPFASQPTHCPLSSAFPSWRSTTAPRST